MNAKLLVTTSFPIVQIKRIDVLSTVLCVVSYFFFLFRIKSKPYDIAGATALFNSNDTQWKKPLYRHNGNKFND